MSKKLKLIIPIIIGIILIVGIISYFLFFRNRGISEGDSTLYFSESGVPYTVRDWKFNTVESKEVIEYINTDNQPKQYVSLCLFDNTYIDIAVPNGIGFYNDICKCVYADDGSYYIRVINNKINQSISEVASIKEFDSLSDNCIASKLGSKGCQTIAASIPDTDYVVIADVYSNSQTYSIIRDSILTAKTYVEEVELNKDLKLDDFPEVNPWFNQYKFTDMSTKVETLYFADGYLSSYARIQPIDSTCKELLAKLCKLSNSDITSYYVKDAFLYAESEYFTLGLFEYNSTTTIVLIGFGEEARADIIQSLKDLMQKKPIP